MVPGYDEKLMTSDVHPEILGGMDRAAGGTRFMRASITGADMTPILTDAATSPDKDVTIGKDHIVCPHRFFHSS